MVSSGVVELENKDGKLFKINGQWIKQYVVVSEDVIFLSLVYVDEILVIAITRSCWDVKLGASRRQPISCCYKMTFRVVFVS